MCAGARAVRTNAGSVAWAGASPPAKRRGGLVSRRGRRVRTNAGGGGGSSFPRRRGQAALFPGAGGAFGQMSRSRHRLGRPPLPARRRCVARSAVSMDRWRCCSAGAFGFGQIARPGPWVGGSPRQGGAPARAEAVGSAFLGGGDSRRAARGRAVLGRMPRAGRCRQAAGPPAACRRLAGAARLLRTRRSGGDAFGRPARSVLRWFECTLSVLKMRALLAERDRYAGGRGSRARAGASASRVRRAGATVGRSAFRRRNGAVDRRSGLPLPAPVAHPSMALRRTAPRREGARAGWLNRLGKRRERGGHGPFDRRCPG